MSFQVMAMEVMYHNKNKCIITILSYFDFLFFKYTYVSDDEQQMLIFHR